VAAPLRATVAPVDMVEGVMLPEIVHSGTVTFRRKVLDAPLAVAVRVALCADVTDATEAVKVPLEAPASTVIVDETVTFALLLAKVTVEPPEGAAELSPTVQVAEPGAATVAGRHERLVTEGVWVILIVPPFPAAGMVIPFPPTAATFVT
jgi:hypothetical protein